MCRDVRPAAQFLFLLRQTKEPKKGGPHLPCPSATLRATCGTRARGGAPELALFASLSPLKHPERASSRSKGILQCPCPPLALRSSARPEGQGDMARAIASLGLGGDRSSWQLGRRLPATAIWGSLLIDHLCVAALMQAPLPVASPARARRYAFALLFRRRSGWPLRLGFLLAPSSVAGR